VKRLSFGVAPVAPADRPASSASRPSSRASNASQTAEHQNPFVRPSSRLSIGGSRTPLGHYSTPVDRRPRSSIGGNYAGTHHTRHTSVNDATPSTPSTARRTTLDKSGLPTPNRRQSGGVGKADMLGRRPSLGLDKLANMPPPAERPRKLSEVGETF